MKTMKLNEEIKRVSNKESYDLVKIGWRYIPKSEWKEKVRKQPSVSTKQEKSSDKKRTNPKGKAKKQQETS